MSSITIYGVGRSRASRNIWLCYEMGIAFEHIPVIQAYRLENPDAPDAPLNTRSPQFRKVNPNGHIPSMADGDLVLHESLAINIYLARKFGGPLAPKDVGEEGLLAMWTLWAATEAEPHSIQILYHRTMRPEAERDPVIAAAAIEALKAPFAVLDGALAETGFIMGGRFTVADINVAEVMRWALPATELFASAPNVKKWLEAAHARPAYQKMMEVRNGEPV